MFFKLASWHQTNAASDLHFKCNHLKEIKYETMNIHIIRGSTYVVNNNDILSTPDTTDGQKAVKQQEERSASYYFFIGEYEKA